MLNTTPVEHNLPCLWQSPKELQMCNNSIHLNLKYSTIYKTINFIISRNSALLFPIVWPELLSFPSNPHCFLVTNTETSLLSVAKTVVIYICKIWKHKLNKLCNTLLTLCWIFSCANLLCFCRTSISHQLCICFKQPYE